LLKKSIAAFVAAGALVAAPLIANAATAMMSMHGMHGMHGMPAGADGPAYTGTPDLKTTSALVAAGGGAETWSTAKALTAMVGPTVVRTEVAKLQKQYGKANVASWLAVSDYSTRKAGAIATAQGVQFPEAPATLTGHKLAVALVTLGSGTGTFYNGTMLDHLVTHGIHSAVMDAIDVKYGTAADANYHRISNQAFVDMAHALGASSIKLASYH
jgi:hypothetical protein